MMRAARYERFGSPDVISIQERAMPRPGPDDVLVQVAGASAGGGEIPILAGQMRRVMPTRPPAGLGNDFSGRIVEVGSNVVTSNVGDTVWGLTPHFTFGSIAEYVSVPARLVAHAPKNVDLVHAAAVPAVGTTVIRALTATADLTPGSRLLVRGASGGVGSIAVQVGRAIGAHVTALVSTRNADWITELGADIAVDYHTAPSPGLGRFDVIIDSVGTELSTYRRLLAPGGTMVALALDPNRLLRTFAQIAVSPRVKTFSNNPTTGDLAELTRYVESETIRPLVHETIPLTDAADAYRQLERGGVRGKIVIAMR